MRALVVVALLLAVAAPARAADNADSLQEAKDHYDRGMAHYELGEFAAAIDEFKLAYARSQAPGLLFNLAQASRLNKDYEQALHFYRAYLRVRPDAANRDDVEKRITELEPVVEVREKAERERLSAASTQPSSPTLIAPTAEVKPSEAPAVVVKPRSSGRPVRIAGLAVGAAGVALLAAGIGVGSAALDAQNKLSALAVQNGSWTPSQASLYSTGQRDAAAATALYVVGGAAIATGVVLYAIGWRRDRARFAVAPTPHGGAQAVWSCAF